MVKQNYSPFTIYYSLSFRLLVLLALPLAVSSIGSAASLQGKVSEIIDGENFTMISQTHLLKVRLVGAAAPAAGQAYSDFAKQHLSDLILNKIVAVRYTGFQEGQLAGQVQCGAMDVNAQMIRDGVAWYNQSEAMNLSDVERGIYQASQDAARNEKRGLWQDAAPISPWDYRKARANAAAAKVLPPPPASVVAPEASAQLKTRGPGLSNENILTGLIRYSAVVGKPEITPLSSNPSPDRWLKYQPADHHFSILFPSVGQKKTLPVQDLQGNILEVSYLVAPTDTNFYYLFWTKGPNGTATTESTSRETVNAFVDGINAASRHPGGTWVEISPVRDVTLNGYAGKQYELTAGPISGTIRILSKQIGQEREVFILCAIIDPRSEDDSDNFFNSFKVK